MKIKPRHNWILCKPVKDRATRTKGGIHVAPESKDAKSILVGEVVAIGPGADNGSGKHIKSDLVEGDQVAIPVNPTVMIHWSPLDRSWFMVQDEDIMGRVSHLDEPALIQPPQMVV